MFKPLPVGIEFFREFKEQGYYYVDKTLFIKELIDKKGKVNLFTRPRRFGKTLTLDMLRCFFEKGEDPTLFDGLKIMGAGERYTSLMGQYPVIFLTLKAARHPAFAESFMALREQIIWEFDRYSHVLENPALNEEDREAFKQYLKARTRYEKKREACRDQEDREKLFQEEVSRFAVSLKVLCSCLKKALGENTIILMDEYDVPLENAFYSGFYPEMISFIRNFFEASLKTNDCLEFAVITGCLRISKESIFTGLNNLAINSIRTPDYGEYFGFTDEEVKSMLAFYSLEDKYAEMRDWYNGYNFGGKNVYNPWSSILYLRDHTGDNRDFFPMSYWANTSSNSIVRDLVDRADSVTKGELERLIEGGSIEKPIHEDITYGEIYDSQDNLWNFMFFTGYLKQIDEQTQAEVVYATLVIPNRETRYIYTEKIRNWFEQKLVKPADRSMMFRALREGDATVLEQEINKLLSPSISYMDSYENFYHGFMVGILLGSDYMIQSNREAGDGRSDILLTTGDVFERAFVIELKAVKQEGTRPVTMERMDEAAEAALKQIDDNRYTDALLAQGFGVIGRYGISFFRKRCRVHYREGYVEPTCAS